MSVLEVANLASGYGEVQILWGVDLSLEQGKLDHPCRFQWCGQDNPAAHYYGPAQTHAGIGHLRAVRISPACRPMPGPNGSGAGA